MQSSEESKPKPLGKFLDSKFGKFVTERVQPVAGDVLDVVGDITGIEVIEKLGEYLQARKGDSSQTKRLLEDFEKFKMEWALELSKLEVSSAVEFLKAEIGDRDSARKRETGFMSFTGGRDWLMGVVVITGLALLVLTVITLVYVEIPKENQRLADMCFGAVMSIGASIFSYYIGTSKSSHVKDETIKKIIDAK
jgi:hypothetical protein